MKNIWAKISYWWFVAMLTIVGFLCGGLEVDAATITPTTTTYMALWCQGRTCNQTEAGATTTTGWLSRGTAYQTTASAPWLMQMKFRTQLNSSNYLQTNNQYLVQYKINLVERQWENQNYDQWIFELNFTYSDNTNSQPTQGHEIASCRPNKNNTYEMICTTTIQPTKAVKEFTFRIYFPFGSNDYLILTQRVNYTSISITGNTDTTDAINNQTIIIDNSINNINDTITDDNVDNPNDMFEEMEDYIPQNGVISSLITLPITLYQKILASINGSCQSFNLGSLYGTNLIMPCIEVSQYLGNTLWSTIDLIISGVFVLTIAKKMIKIFNSFTSLKEGDVIND